MGLNWRSRLQQALTNRKPDSDAALEAQLDGKGPYAAPQLEARQIPPAAIAANPRQPRQTLSDESLEDLVDSIAQHGILQPILVRQLADGYELVAGQRRLRAAQLLGLDEISAVVTQADDEDTGLLALVENLQREGLGFMEEATAYERLLREFGLTQEELARRLGKSQSTVANKLRLLRLPDAVRTRILSPSFTERHARALLGLRNAESQLRVADAIESKALTVRQTEALVERLAIEEAADGSVVKRKPTQSWRAVFRDARILSNTFRAAVERLRQAGMTADLEQIEREEGLEIRVLVHLPPGWREGSKRGPD